MALNFKYIKHKRSVESYMPPASLYVPCLLMLYPGTLDDSDQRRNSCSSTRTMSLDMIPLCISFLAGYGEILEVHVRSIV